jgi:hypothetical protein
VKDAIHQYRGRSQQQPDGLIAVEGSTLVFTAELALLLDGVAF